MGNKARYKKRSDFRFLDLFIIVFFLFIAVVSLYLFRLDLLNTFKLQNVEPAGTVIIKKNTVQRRLGDRVIWDRLNTESPVYVGDLIRVADISAATLYIKGNSIELDENTLIRIVLSPDGEGLQIIMTSGTVAVFAEKGAEKVSLNLNGKEIKSEPGTVLRAAVPEKGEATVKVYESVQKFVEEVPLRKIAEPRLLSPAANSVFHYSEELPSLNFQWTSVEEATSYILQVSSSPDFSGLRINISTSAVSASVNDLGRGLWYWRVMLGLPLPYSSSPVFSNTSFFRIEQHGSGRVEPVQNGSIAEWLAEEAPPVKPPPEVPREVLMESPLPTTSIPAVQAQASEPVKPPPEKAPPPPALFAAPQIIQPAQRAIYGFEQLLSQRNINFRWSSVRGANAYILTLYEQTADGRRQILRTTINRGTRYTMDNLRLLEKGTFVWQVEAVRVGRNNVIEQHGKTTDNIFTVNFPAPTPVEIEDAGILYGN
ncbi:FecR family protein [Treponema sp. R6D11]